MGHTTQDVRSHSSPLYRRAPTAPRAGGTLATRLTWLAATLALGAALVGLLVDGIYGGSAATAEMFRAYDLVTAAVVVPALAVACLLAQHGSLRAPLICASLVAYLVYTYAYYLFGTGFNDLFLLHAAAFAAALAALVTTTFAMDAAAIADRFSERTRVRTVAGILGALAVALGGMWAYAALDYAITGHVPAGSQLVETDTIVHLGIALDLTLLVPLYAASAALLWKRAPWGYVLASIALFGGVLHQVTYVVAMPFQVAASIPAAVSYDIGEPVIVLTYLVAAVLLLRGAGTGRDDANEGPGAPEGGSREER